jgi:hypothetical protein
MKEYKRQKVEVSKFSWSRMIKPRECSLSIFSKTSFRFITSLFQSMVRKQKTFLNKVLRIRTLLTGSFWTTTFNFLTEFKSWLGIGKNANTLEKITLLFYYFQLILRILLTKIYLKVSILNIWISLLHFLTFKK